MTIATARLLLRPWREADFEPVAAMFADAIVMRYFDRTRTQAQTRAWLDRVQAHFAAQGFGLWAVEIPGEAPFIGFVGLSTVPRSLPIAPATEAVWTLAQAFWGHGYAGEAARAAIDDGFARLGLREIVAFTAAVNTPSRRVMAKIGMRHAAGEAFDHPAIAEGHELRNHVVYRIRPDATPKV